MEEINVKTINDPKFLKTLSYKELNLLCANIREEIINATSVNGGHVASNLGVVELTVALHRTFDFSKDKLLLDVGHQCYTHKILTGRSLDKLRKKMELAAFKNVMKAFMIVLKLDTHQQVYQQHLVWPLRVI